MAGEVFVPAFLLLKFVEFLFCLKTSLDVANHVEVELVHCLLNLELEPHPVEFLGLFIGVELGLFLVLSTGG